MDIKTNKQILMFRLHKWSDEDKLIRFLHGYGKHILVYEKPDNSREHLQGIVIDESKRQMLPKSFSDKFRKKLQENQDTDDIKIKGNGDISTKPYFYNEDDKYNYFFKGDTRKKLPLVLLNNIVDDEEKAKEDYWIRHDELKHRDGNKKWYKIKQYRLSEKMEEKYHNNKEVLWAMRIIGYNDSIDNQIPDDYQIKKLVRTYMIKDTPIDRKEKFIESIARNIYQE